MRKRRLPILRLLLLLVLLLGIGLAFRQGLVPARYSPLPALDLDSPLPLVVVWEIAELRRDSVRGSRVLVPPHIEAVAIRDNPLRNGCGWTNSVRVSSVGGARLPVDKLSCQAATLSATHFGGTSGASTPRRMPSTFRASRSKTDAGFQCCEAGAEAAAPRQNSSGLRTRAPADTSAWRSARSSIARTGITSTSTAAFSRPAAESGDAGRGS